MDLAYLHALQDLRAALPHFVEQFFVLLSYIGDGPALVALVLVIYWCFSKRVGQRALTSLALGVYANQLLKNILCVYRPWVRDPTIVPAGAAIEGAGGYSFPSGHTSATAGALGSLAWQERKQRRWVVAVGVIVTALMMFARNYLGVHTPQDVVVGLILAFVGIAAAEGLHDWIDCRDEEAGEGAHDSGVDRIVLVAALVIAVVTILFVTFKAYPLDYVDGELLVDPEEMRKGCFEAAGLWLGWALGWALERRFVNFSTEDLDTRTRIIRCVVGVGLVGVSYLLGSVVFKAILPYNVAKLVQMTCVALVGTYAAPAVFSAVERR